jgi:hypothetical protein
VASHILWQTIRIREKQGKIWIEHQLYIFGAFKNEFEQRILNSCHLSLLMISNLSRRIAPRTAPSRA